MHIRRASRRGANVTDVTSRPAYDDTALTRRIGWREVAADQPWVFRDALIGVGIVVGGILYLWWMVATLPLDLPEPWRPLGDAVGIVAGILAVVAGMAIILGGFLATQPLTERRRLRVRLFAAANGLEYRAHGIAPPPVGILFGGGKHVAVTDQLGSPSGRSIRGRTGTKTVGFTIGNATFSERNASGGRGKSVGQSGFVHVALTARSPHLLLDAVANNGGARRGIGAAVAREQLISLEGDFDRHFALYCAPGFQVEALQVFTPDVMALLIDHGSRWDVEIVDDDLFVSTLGGFKLWDVDEMRRLLAFIDLVVPKLGGRIDRMSPVELRPSRHDGSPTRGERLLAGRRLVVIPVAIGIALVAGVEILAAVTAH